MNDVNVFFVFCFRQVIVDKTLCVQHERVKWLEGCRSAKLEATFNLHCCSRIPFDYKQRCGADTDAGRGSGWLDQPEARGGDERCLCAVPHVSRSCRGPGAAQGRRQGHTVFGKLEQTRKRSAEKGELQLRLTRKKRKIRRMHVLRVLCHLVVPSRHGGFKAHNCLYML